MPKFLTRRSYFYTKNNNLLSAIVFIFCTWLGLNSTINAEILIQQTQGLQFPKALVASSGNARIVVKHNGQLGSSTTATIVGTNYNAGEYLLSSDTSNTFTVNITSDENIPGVQLKSFKFRYEGTTYKNFPASGLPNPGSGTVATLGVKVLYNTSIDLGEVQPSFTLTVTEDL